MAKNFLDEFWGYVSTDSEGNKNFLSEFEKGGQLHGTYEFVEDAVKAELRGTQTPEQKAFDEAQGDVDTHGTDNEATPIKKDYLIYGGIAAVGAFFLFGGA